MAGRMNVPGKPALEGIGATTKTPSSLEGGCWDTCGCTGNRRGGRGQKVKEIRTSIFLQTSRFLSMGFKIIGGETYSTRTPPHQHPPTSKYYQPHRLRGASPQAPGRQAGQIVRGGQTGILWKPVRRQSGGRPVKVNCH